MDQYRGWSTYWSPEVPLTSVICSVRVHLSISLPLCSNSQQITAPNLDPWTTAKDYYTSTMKSGRLLLLWMQNWKQKMLLPLRKAPTQPMYIWWTCYLRMQYSHSRPLWQPDCHIWDGAEAEEFNKFARSVRYRRRQTRKWKKSSFPSWLSMGGDLHVHIVNFVAI